MNPSFVISDMHAQPTEYFHVASATTRLPASPVPDFGSVGLGLRDKDQLRRAPFPACKFHIVRHRVQQMNPAPRVIVGPFATPRSLDRALNWALELNNC
jgi:hypothetical protein